MFRARDYFLKFATVFTFFSLASAIVHPLFAQQDIYYFEWDQKILDMANTAKDVSYLSHQEKKLIFYTNLSRMNGSLFAKTYLQAYIKENKITKDKWYRSLIDELSIQEPLEPLYPQKDLCEVAKKHSKDMGASGRIGKRATTGELYVTRSEDIRKVYTYVRENSQYGYNEGLSILCDLLIDEDFKTFIHRKTFLKPDSKFIGVSIAAHKKLEYNCVIEFGGEKIKKESSEGYLE